MPIVNGIITLEEAKASIFNSTTVPAGIDSDLEEYIAAATPVIESLVGPMTQRSAVLTYDGGRSAVVLPWPFADVISVTESGTPITDYVADPSAGIIFAGTTPRARDFLYGIRNITVTVLTGPPDGPPANVRMATRELVRFWWQQGRQGNRPAYGTGDVDTVDTPQGFAVPRRVVELCSPNRQVGGFA